jgi:hypothetical protein
MSSPSSTVARACGDAGLLDAEARRLGAIDHHQDLVRRVLDRVVDVDDVGGVSKASAHLLGDGDLAVVVDAVDLGHQRREHRRAGRDLDDLGVAVVASAMACSGSRSRAAILWLCSSRWCLSTRLTWMSPRCAPSRR